MEKVKKPQISPTIRRHSSNVKTYDAIQFRDKLRRGVSLENIGPHRVCFYPQPTPSHRNTPNANRPVIFSKNPIGSASKNISRKVSSYSKMSSLARVAWSHLTITTPSQTLLPSTDKVTTTYQKQYTDMTPFIKKIVKNHPRVLVYYGDTDMACNFMMGQQFADQLGLRRTLKKTPWKFNRQIAGFKTLPGS
ncbi:hypothetical protein GCK72_013082 [Caenorhabditis remanei]|uniref:Uncharacterized protein n=1 Tax=Caenorhabditis remanei TaxID=31234 RepID=A0A6A5GMM8_CAERE|nr:hypothetical protein GCK72_013082 [Caenorhabditis remanei]KAF1756628.1 hypothetical protein GCK72_013082 [Caenorhabditis remanei]